MNESNDNRSDPFDLVDGASGKVLEIKDQVWEHQKIARDPSYPIERRLESYEDIIDSEVGDTAMVRARNIERKVLLRQIYLKFEGGNPSGTQKDRIAFAQAMDAMRRGFDGITVASCGNYGVAAALASSLAGIDCIIFIPKDYHTKRIGEMEELGAKIVRSGEDYEDSVKRSREYAQTHEFYDANPGGANTTLQLQAYGQIAYEIYDDLRDAPQVVAVPVSNGSTIAGIYKGFLSLYRRGKTSRMPKMVAGSSYRKNAIIQAFINGLDSCPDLEPAKIRETEVNEPLINWHSIDGDLALEAIRNTGGWAGNASDSKMRSYSKLIRNKEGLNVLPASTAGLIAFIQRHQRDPFPNDRYVVILTGKKQ